jgi:hypothetical protein
MIGNINVSLKAKQVIMQIHWHICFPADAFKNPHKGDECMVYSIEQFRVLNKPETIFMTQHSRKRFAERNIKLSDVCEVINSGTIIEEYPDDFPYPSCLILGKSNGRSLHVCASLNDGMIYVITSYVPDISKWKSDLKTRKEEA